MRSSTMPIIMFAIREPCNRVETIRAFRAVIVTLATYRPEDHVQGHRDVEVEGVVVGHTGHEEHEHEQEIVLEADIPPLGAELLRHHESFQGHEQELAEGDQVARARVMSAGGLGNDC